MLARPVKASERSEVDEEKLSDCAEAPGDVSESIERAEIGVELLNDLLAELSEVCGAPSRGDRAFPWRNATENKRAVQRLI